MSADDGFTADFPRSHNTPTLRGQYTRVWQKDPHALQRTLNRLEPFTAAEQSQLSLPIRTAYERLRTGAGSAQDFHDLAGAINVTMVRCEAIDPLAEVTAIDARDALMRCWQRHLDTGKWGFDGPALQALPPAIDLHEQLLALSTPLQMAQALQETIRRMTAGDVLQANVHQEAATP